MEREAVETMVDVQSDLRCTWVLAKKNPLTCRFFLFTIFPKNIKFRYPFVSNTYNRHKLLHGNVSYIHMKVYYYLNKFHMLMFMVSLLTEPFLFKEKKASLFIRIKIYDIPTTSTSMFVFGK